MTTTEILANFLKGNERTSISQKQKDWLLSQAKKDGVKTHFDGFNDNILLTDCHYSIRHAKTHVSGYGGTRGTRVIPDRYILDKLYTIKFESTGLTKVCSKTDLQYYDTTPHKYTIINQL